MPLLSNHHHPLSLGPWHLLSSAGKIGWMKTEGSKIIACFDCRAFIVIISLTALSFSESDHFANKDCVLFYSPFPSRKLMAFALCLCAVSISNLIQSAHTHTNTQHNTRSTFSTCKFTIFDFVLDCLNLNQRIPIPQAHSKETNRQNEPLAFGKKIGQLGALSICVPQIH